jgi:hypothetical protein
MNDSNIFDSILIKKEGSSFFNQSHSLKTAFNFGELVPVLCDELVPGDKINLNIESMIKSLPMLAPLMHEIDVYFHAFVVPERLVFDEYEKFTTGGESGTEVVNVPKLLINESRKANFNCGKLPDYLTIPTCDAGTTVQGEIEISALPFRAYQLIYNTWYRAQEITDPIEFDTGTADPDASEQTRLTTLRKRGVYRDYYR